ncbi:hypothetical protein GCM10027048_36590 [Hymenobacter coalescens]
MIQVKRILIENFRGIRMPLEISFKKGKNFTSVGLYGRNGTGKSSIADAWEWLQSGKISHLTRENSGEKDYPNKYVGEGECYIEVEFEGDINGVVKSSFDKKKITIPKIEGEFDDFKMSAKHPCYLRYRELQQFVYNTKADKYAYMAKYLGFEKQLKFQVDLFSYSKQLNEEYYRVKSDYDEKRHQVLALVGGDEVNEGAVINALAAICEKYGFDKPTGLLDLKRPSDQLQVLIDSNPLNNELNQWMEFRKKLVVFNNFNHIIGLVDDLVVAFDNLKSDEEILSKVILSDLYSSALVVLRQNDFDGSCPVCDNVFDGDLLAHIREKHESLVAFQQLKESYDKKCALAKSSLSVIKNACVVLCGEGLDIVRAIEVNVFMCSNKLPDLVDAADSLLVSKVQDIENLEALIDVKLALLELLDIVGVVDAVAEFKIEQLSKDLVVKNLANDYERARALYQGYGRFVMSKVKKDKYEHSSVSIEKVYTNYVEWMQSKLLAAFGVISKDVMLYFNILEQTASHISEPTIKLNTDKNKAVELEIKFNNEVISPVYKYLSESQINSFGLSVFLAAIKNFNPDFKFVILDDIVNSFDAFKRPRIIELLQIHFKDYQFLVLTHDVIWFERLLKAFKQWNKLRFESWDLTHGPKVNLGKSVSEQIEECIKSDNAVQAGQLLGRYLEFSLQDYNYSLEGMLKYKPDNQYVLSELLDALIARVNKDLKVKHLLYQKLNDFSSDSMFRNYCAHYKAPETEFTVEEIDIIYKKWMDIESLLRCDDCGTYVRKNSDDIYCQCRSLNLKDAKFTVAA